MGLQELWEININKNSWCALQDTALEQATEIFLNTQEPCVNISLGELLNYRWANCIPSLSLLYTQLYTWAGFVDGFHFNLTALLSQTLNKIVNPTSYYAVFTTGLYGSVTIQELISGFP